MDKSDLKELWMPSEILINDKLSDKEKIILSMIIYLSKNKGYCFATNNYFSDILNVTVVSISRIINSLKKKNYIKMNMNYKSNSKEKNLNLKVTDKAKEFILEKGTDLKYGARPLRRTIQKYIEDEIAEKLLRGEFIENNHTICVDYKDNQITIN